MFLVNWFYGVLQSLGLMNKDAKVCSVELGVQRTPLRRGTAP